MDRDEELTQDSKKEPAEARRPYRAPVLRHLGSVRELTLGSPMGIITDMKGGLFTPVM